METTTEQQEVKVEVKPVVETLTKRQVALENINASGYDRVMLIALTIMGAVGVGAGAMGNTNWAIACSFGVLALSIYLTIKKDKWIYYLNDKYGNKEWNVWAFHKYMNRKAK